MYSLKITIDNYEKQANMHKKVEELNCQQFHETEKFPHHEVLECSLKCWNKRRKQKGEKSEVEKGAIIH